MNDNFHYPEPGDLILAKGPIEFIYNFWKPGYYIVTQVRFIDGLSAPQFVIDRPCINGDDYICEYYMKEYCQVLG